MTQIELKTELESKDMVSEVADISQWKYSNTIFDFVIANIPYVKIRENGVILLDNIEVAVRNKDNAELEEVLWWRAVPEPLRESATPEPTREAYHTEVEYITGIETEFSGWKVLKLQISQDNDLDRLIVTALNDTKDLVVNEQIIVWKEGSETKWRLVEKPQ